MKHESLLRMSESQLDLYAKVCGVDVSGVPTIAGKVEALESSRERTADIDVMGMVVTVPIKRLHDKRILDRLDGQAVSDSEFISLLEDILGSDQYGELVEHCTDDDGTVDSDALVLSLGIIVNSPELKNFNSSRG